MREVCEQCQRLVASWRKPVLQDNRIFCSQACAEQHEIVEDRIHGSLKPIETYQIAAPHRRPYAIANAW